MPCMASFRFRMPRPLVRCSAGHRPDRHAPAGSTSTGGRGAVKAPPTPEVRLMRKLALAALLITLPAAAQQKSGKTAAIWWGHSAFFVKSPAGGTIAIHPRLKNPPAPPDWHAPEQSAPNPLPPAPSHHRGRLLQVKTVLPMHFGTFPVLTGTPEQLSAALKKSATAARVLTFKPGETKEF